jgi:hypothetical protein
MASHKIPWFQTTNQLRIWIQMDGFLLTFTKQFCSSENIEQNPAIFSRQAAWQLVGSQLWR